MTWLVRTWISILINQYIFFPLHIKVIIVRNAKIIINEKGHLINSNMFKANNIRNCTFLFASILTIRYRTDRNLCKLITFGIFAAIFPNYIKYQILFTFSKSIVYRELLKFDEVTTVWWTPHPNHHHHQTHILLTCKEKPKL